MNVLAQSIGPYSSPLSPVGCFRENMWMCRAFYEGLAAIVVVGNVWHEFWPHVAVWEAELNRFFRSRGWRVRV